MSFVVPHRLVGSEHPPSPKAASASTRPMRSRRARFFAGASALLVASMLASSVAQADVVVLTNGKKIEGKIVTQVIGQAVVIELKNGTQRTIPWKEIRSVDQDKPTASAAPSSAPPAPPPPPATARPPVQIPADPPPIVHRKELGTAELDSEAEVIIVGGSAAATPAPTAGSRPGPSGAVTGEIKGTSAEVTAKADCATNDDERCKAEGHGTLGPDGLRAEARVERVTRVREPRSGAAMIGVAAQGLGGFADTFSITGFNAAGQLKLLQGGQFPGAEGGWWFGVQGTPTLAGGFQQVTTKIPGQPEMKSTSGAVSVEGTAGLQLMHFGAQDATTLKQAGWGGYLGVTGGKRYTSAGDGSWSSTYGPAFGVVRPELNPGTGKLEMMQVNVFVLPLSSALFVVLGVEASVDL